MKWKNISTHKEYVSDFVNFFKENGIIYGEPFQCGGTESFPVWKVPYMAIGTEQSEIVMKYLKKRIEEDRV